MLAAVLVSLGLIAAVLYRPATQVLESRRSLAQAEEKLAEEKARTQELEERRERDLGEEYVEGEARKMGYVKPGEIPLIVLDEKEDALRGGEGEDGAEGDGTGQEEGAASVEVLP